MIKCGEVGEKASKEFQIETMLKSMQNQWKDSNKIILKIIILLLLFAIVTLKVSNYKTSGIIKGYDDI